MTTAQISNSIRPVMAKQSSKKWKNATILLNFAKFSLTQTEKPKQPVAKHNYGLLPKSYVVRSSLLSQLKVSKSSNKTINYHY